jgi:methionyl-tRNA formyltransferase
MSYAILTSPSQWFVPFAKELTKSIRDAKLYYHHSDVNEKHKILFILGYHRVVPDEILGVNDFNLVVHESELPKGKGWAPYFWQILEGSQEIVFSMIEASSSLDAGRIFIQKKLVLQGTELHDELRKKQGQLTVQMCQEIYDVGPENVIPREQTGLETYYRKRTPVDSELDVHKTISDQFNLLRTVSNYEFPAFFYIKGKKYKVKIENYD